MKEKKDSGYLIEAIVLAAVLVLSLPLRTVQYYSVIEPGTGFFTNITPTVILFFAVLGIATVYFIASGFAKRKKYVLETNADRKPGNGIIAALCGVAIGISAFQEYTLKDVDTSKYTVSATTSTSASGMLIYIEEVFAVLAASYFILLAISFLAARASSDFKLLSLTPVVWMIFRLVIRFTRTISYVRVSDLMLEMLMIVFFALFLMAFAQCNSEVNADGNDWRLAAFGLPAAMLGFICFIPRALLTVTGHSDAIYALSRADVSDFAIALFAVATVASRLVTKANNVITTPVPQEEKVD